MGTGVLTDGVRRVDAGLHCDRVPLDAIARSAGTPTYVYNAATIRAQYGRLAHALRTVSHRLHYSVKANSNLAILAMLRELGAGVDIVSGGELHRALAAGFRGDDVVFSGVGKTAVELEQALRARIKLFNVESEGELRLLDEIAGALGVRAPVALRVNPEVSVDTPHPYTRTGEKGMKFGIPVDEVPQTGALAESLPNIALVGLDMHIGSQVSSLEPYERGLMRLLDLVTHFQRAGSRELRYLDVGGGLAVTYQSEVEADLQGFGEMIAPLVAPTGLELILEPGRFLVGNAGVLLTRVLYRKRSGGKEFIITDAGMNDLLRPSHYNAYHRIDAVHATPGRTVADVVGPVCESGDFFAVDRELDDVAPGDLLVIRSAGAYGYVMASNYNSRPRPAEVMVDGDRWRVVAARETYDDLLRLETRPAEWRTT